MMLATMMGLDEWIQNHEALGAILVGVACLLWFVAHGVIALSRRMTAPFVGVCKTCNAQLKELDIVRLHFNSKPAATLCRPCWNEQLWPGGKLPNHQLCKN